MIIYNELFVINRRSLFRVSVFFRLHLQEADANSSNLILLFDIMGGVFDV